MPDLTANTHTELFLKAIAEGSTTPEGLVPENHLELWLQQIMEMGGVSGNYVRYTEQELSAAEEAQARDNIGAAGMEDLAPAYDSTIPYKVGNLLSASGKMYLTIKDAPAGTPVTNTEYFEEKSVADIVEMIKNGSIVVGHSDVADNLTPYSEDSGTTQENPFISQGTGTDNNSVIVTTGTIARQLEKQGNTITKCQLFRGTSKTQNGITITANQNGSITLNGTSTAETYDFIALGTGYTFPMVAGHKYFIQGANKLYKASTQKSNLHIPSVGGNPNLGSISSDGVYIPTISKDDAYIYLYVENGCTFNNLTVFITIFDITSWDSSIITDLTSHPEHFSWYYNGSLAYDAGSLQNCNGRYLECGQGRNLFDQQTELGGYSSETGEKTTGSSTLRSKDFIVVVPNTPVYFKVPHGVWIYCYDSNKNFIKNVEFVSGSSRNYMTLDSNGTKTMPSNCWFITIQFRTEYGTTYHYDASVEKYYTAQEGGEGYGEMHDYIAPIRIDTGNEQLLAFDTKDPNGTWHKNTKTKDLGTITYTASGSSGIFYASFASFPIVKNTDKMIANGYITSNVNTNWNIDSLGDKTIHMFYANGYYYLIVANSAFAGYTAEQAKTALSGTILNYLTDAPTTEQGTPFSEYAPINDYSYMAWFDTDGNLVSIPQGCKLFYPVDYKGFLDDGVMYTNGDFTALAKGEDITDTALNARGYYKLQDLSSSITDIAGLTYSVKKLVKNGNIYTMTVYATNGTGSEITGANGFFSLPSGAYNTSVNFVFASRKTGANINVNIMSANGKVTSSDNLANGDFLFVSATWIV